MSTAWGGGSGFFSIDVLDLLAPDPWKMPAIKCHCDHFAAIFVPRSLTASQIGLGIIFQKNAKKCDCFYNKRAFNSFRRNQSSIRPARLDFRRKITANGLSSYELFVNNLIFFRQKFKFSSVFDIFWKGSVTLLWKSHFSILSTFAALLRSEKGITVR